MTGEQAAVSSRGLTVRYGDITALDCFTVTVPRGIVGLLGPNGAGKSTFIKAVLGLLEPDAGQITVAGRDPASDWLAVRDMVGYMPEHDCLMDTFTAVELVSYMARMSGLRKSDAMPRCHEMLDFVGVGEERYRPISSYSTGMKQRVKLAQAIVHDPQILFLDEPTNGMDPQGREDMLALIGKIRESEKTILVSTHILDDLERVSDHAVIISGGRMVTQGSLDELLAGSEGFRMVKARGSPEALDRFTAAIRSQFDVRSSADEGGQRSLVIVNKGSSAPVFRMAGESGVQVRAYYPEKATLEDVFIGAVRGGGDGH